MNPGEWLSSEIDEVGDMELLVDAKTVNEGCVDMELLVDAKTVNEEIVAVGDMELLVDAKTVNEGCVDMELLVKVMSVNEEYRRLHHYIVSNVIDFKLTFIMRFCLIFFFVLS